MSGVVHVPARFERGSAAVFERLPAIEHAPPLGSICRSATAALALILLALVGWVAMVPLESAVIARGLVAVESHRKTVQGREGGIIKVLRVREGDRVEQGDILVEFDRVQAAANYEVFDTQYTRALAQLARLRAELANAAVINWPEELTQRRAEHRIAETLAVEQSFLDSRNREFTGQVQITLRKVAELQERLPSVGAETAAVQEQLRLIREEEQDVATLVTKGLARKPRLLELQRALAGLTGKSGQLRAERSQLREALAGAEQELLNVEHKRRSTIIDELTAVEGRVAEYFDRRIGAHDMLENTQVLAPVAGTVVDLRFFGPRAVVGAGEPILDLVPVRDEMIVVGKVRPSDVDAVYVGQSAEVRLMSYNQREVEPVPAIIETVSADSLSDPTTGESYYQARVRLDRGALEAQPMLKLHPGMPADVVILTGERTFFEYLVAPVTRYLYLSFREE